MIEPVTCLRHPGQLFRGCRGRAVRDGRAGGDGRAARPFLARRLLHDLPKVPRYDRHGRLAKTYEHPQISSPAACRSLPQPAAACRSLCSLPQPAYFH